MPDPKSPHELAEELIENAEADESTDDLLRGTEVYEEDSEYSDGGDPTELDFEPAESFAVSADDPDSYPDDDNY